MAFGFFFFSVALYLTWDGGRSNVSKKVLIGLFCGTWWQDRNPSDNTRQVEVHEVLREERIKTGVGSVQTLPGQQRNSQVSGLLRKTQREQRKTRKWL